MTVIGITMGCPAGIGPEIILKYCSQYKKDTKVIPVILGDITVLEKCAADLGLKNNLSFFPWLPGDDFRKNGFAVMQLSSLSSQDIVYGTPSRKTGQAMAHYIETAVTLAQEGSIGGIVTCPISKASLNDAGYLFPGHTEMLASLTETDSFGMMMAGSSLRVTLVTIHCSLKEVPVKISEEKIYSLLMTTHKALQHDFAIDSPKIAVAGLNPHGGEEQLFGSEEVDIIEPAIRKARKQSIEVTGPFPPDTVFYQAAGGKYDAVVCMYHDQGLIPFKLLHFEDGVNVTLGLSIVRTSVDHGTAYDIAGKGMANPKSLIEAICMAAEISDNRSSQVSKV